LSKWKQLKFIDIIVFLEMITSNIEEDSEPLDREIVLHPTCSTHKMSDFDVLEKLAQRCASSVIIPNNSSCCGFAGDRGLIVPELTDNATKHNKNGLSDNIAEGYSSSRMCEIGMSETNLNYRNIAFLVRDFLLTK
jgi:D-lactate dehydrogenase